MSSENEFSTFICHDAQWFGTYNLYVISWIFSILAWKIIEF